MTIADDHSRGFLDELQRQFQLLEESRDQTDAIVARATAKDRSVAVEANAAGHIVSVEILQPGDPAKLGAAITICANNALQAAQKAADEKMVAFFEAQAAVVGDFADRTGVDLTEMVHRESHAPAIPEHLLSEEAYRRSRE